MTRPNKKTVAPAKLQVNKVIKLSKEQNARLTETPLRNAKETFEELASWRNRSLSSTFTV